MDIRFRNTKIVATVGPATSGSDKIERLARTGVNVFRLNFSHGTHEDHQARYNDIRAAEKTLGRPLGILADMQGPKLRVGRFENSSIILENGQTFTLDLNEAPGTQERVCLPHPEIIATAKIDSRLLLDDGKLVLKVTGKTDNSIETVVVVGGKLSDHKGVNVPDVTLPIPILTKKDRADLDFALSLGVDFIAISFVQTAKDVQTARDIIKGRAAIVSKIEKPQALEEISGIVALSEAIMIARGDLGVECPAETVPLSQKRILKEAHKQGRPVIVATQMLESMISSPSPTRAEVSDVAQAVYDGADATMLSAESASGSFPFDAVATMDRVIREVETDSEWRDRMKTLRPEAEETAEGALLEGAAKVSDVFPLSAIVTESDDVKYARLLSNKRVLSKIISFTSPEEARRLCLYWGVWAQSKTVAQSVIRDFSIEKWLNEKLKKQVIQGAALYLEEEKKQLSGFKMINN
ncbi:pyruvate kinase [Acetobacteraceae bacterium]|nr:pyruvate kinase [Acetobacteraceae bacterium]